MMKSRKVKEFTKDQDDLIIQSIRQWGPKWKKISEVINKTARQCRDRYKKISAPIINRSTWTLQEEDLLLSLVEHSGHQWLFFQQFFQNRSSQNIKHHYYIMMKHKTLHEKNEIQKLYFNTLTNTSINHPTASDIPDSKCEFCCVSPLIEFLVCGEKSFPERHKKFRK